MKRTGENRSTRGKTCPSATLALCSGGRLATNRLSHGTALNVFLVHLYSKYAGHPTQHVPHTSGLHIGCLCECFRHFDRCELCHSKGMFTHTNKTSEQSSFKICALQM
jgi:hypothetical protein